MYMYMYTYIVKLGQNGGSGTMGSKNVGSGTMVVYKCVTLGSKQCVKWDFQVAVSPPPPPADIRHLSQTTFCGGVAAKIMHSYWNIPIC